MNKDIDSCARVQQVGTRQAQSSSLYIWEHWNGEGAWKLMQLPFQSSLGGCTVYYV